MSSLKKEKEHIVPNGSGVLLRCASPTVSQVALRDNRQYSGEALGSRTTVLSALVTVHVSLVAV